MLVVFLSFLSLIFKWLRLLFILISFEFILMSCFFIFSFVNGGMAMVFFISVSVVTSLLGLIMIVNNVFFFGSDMVVF
uniref:NADH dehydrogenase subunit 4L n=1 Tax=Wellcomia compar TaxID=2744580 RepID=A0A8F7CIP3_9BILA|nr:NADH dehydrogenase subunit 4L [Wellcomia compar]